MNWYVIKTKPKKENEVALQLKRLPGESFLPLMRGVVSPKPLFPSYLFTQTDLGDPYLHRMVRFTRGVSRILGDDDGPLPVSNQLVETIIQRCNDCSIVERDLLFREGDGVRIKKGILKDLVGMIDRKMSGHDRVKVLFRWLGSTMSAVLKYTDMEKVT